MLTYRPDIDGLRAIAVLTVVLYHADVPFFTGGFVGVDIFFVISGYLITAILKKDIEAGKFSLLKFYDRRIRRIFPALFAVFAVCSIVSAFLLLPEDFNDFAKSMVAATLFASNLYFWRSADYFAGAAEEKPLLHTWSLAVEEQFYIVWPFILFALLVWIGKKPRVALIILGTIISLIMAEFFIQAGQYREAFYLPFTRAWELMFGAILALNIIPKPSSTRIASMAGILALGLIAFATVFYTHETSFPGLSALLPCLGAALIIWAGQKERALTHKLLSWKPAIFVGLISYSLYLWHWPVLSYMRYVFQRDLSIPEIAIALISSFVLAVLSWWFVEQPFRKHIDYKGKIPRSVYAGLLAMIVFSGIGVGVYMTKGTPQRFPQDLQNTVVNKDREHRLHRKCLIATKDSPNFEKCMFGAEIEAPPTVLVWGDSHADHWTLAMDEIFKEKNIRGIQATKNACPPLLGTLRVDGDGRRRKDCTRFNDNVLAVLQKTPSIKTVIITGRWALTTQTTRFGQEHGGRAYLTDPQNTILDEMNSKTVFENGLDRTIKALQKADKNVVLIGQAPEVGYNSRRCLSLNAQYGLHLTCTGANADVMKVRLGFTDQQLLSAEGRYKNVEAFTISGPACEGNFCVIEKEGKAFYIDDDHLTKDGGLYLLEKSGFTDFF